MKYYRGQQIMMLGIWMTLGLTVISSLFIEATTIIGIIFAGVVVSCFAGYLFGEFDGQPPIIPIFRRKE